MKSCVGETKQAPCEYHWPQGLTSTKNSLTHPSLSGLAVWEVHVGLRVTGFFSPKLWRMLLFSPRLLLTSGPTAQIPSHSWLFGKQQKVLPLWEREALNLLP